MTTLIAPTVAGAPCTACGCALVTERNAEPWCARCGWNIDCYEPARRHPEIGWRWVDRLTFRAAYQLNARQFASLSGRTVDRIRFGWINALMTVISLVMLAVVVGIAVEGVWLMVNLRNFLGYFLGVVLLLFAWALHPRLGRIDKDADHVTRESAPTLYRLIDDVVAASGARGPHVVVCSTRFGATSFAYGFRRRRALSIGLSLWLSSTPQQQVALVGHEVGHFTNGDVRRGMLTSLAFTMFHTLSEVTRPERHYARRAGDTLARVVLAVIHSFFAIIQIFICWIGLRASHRAEYSVDELAARVGGSEAATGLLDMLMLDQECTTVLRRVARTDTSPAAWRAAIHGSKATMAARIPRLRQLSMRDDASLFRSHPPAGLRAQLIASRPQVSAKVVLSEADSARIDQELAGYYKSMRTEMIN